MTKNALRKVLDKIKSSLEQKVSIRRCVVKCNTVASVGWHKFAELTTSNTSNNIEIVFDVSDLYHIFARESGNATGYGRLIVNIRTEGSVINENRTGIQWMYTNGGIHPEDFVLAHKYDEGTNAHKFELWTNVRIQYIARHFNVSYSTALSTAWVDKWSLYNTSSTTPGTIPSDMQQITSSYGYLLNQVNNIPVLKSMTITGTTTESGNLQLISDDRSKTLTTANSVILQCTTDYTTGANKGTVVIPVKTVGGGNMYAHCMSATPDHTAVVSEEITVTVLYYEL